MADDKSKYIRSAAPCRDRRREEARVFASLVVREKMPPLPAWLRTIERLGSPRTYSAVVIVDRDHRHFVFRVVDLLAGAG